MRRRLLRNLVYLLSLGLAVHLLLPQIPGLESSVGLISNASKPLIVAAFLSEIASEMSYAELLGRSAGLASGFGASARARRRARLGRWYTLRLTVTGYGAAHVLPGGGAASAAVTYEALRHRGMKNRQIAMTVGVVTALVYAALGTVCVLGLLYLILDHRLRAFASTVSVLALALAVVLFIGSYFAYRNPRTTRRAFTALLRPIGGLLSRLRPNLDLDAWTTRVTGAVRDELRAVKRQFSGRPREASRLVGLAFGYWGFDAVCLVLMFRAAGVEAGVVELLVAYGLATAVGALPLTPGGIGVFETTILALLALFGVGSEAIVPVLGYRIFNFWMPIPLAAIFYPVLHRGKGKRVVGA